MVKTFEEFVLKEYPELKKRYEISLLTPEELIGKVVISIRPGYGSSWETVMEVCEIVHYNDVLYIKTRRYDKDRSKQLVYSSTKYDDVPNSFILVDY